MGIEQFFNVTYKLVSSDNFEAYLEEMNVENNLRQAICSAIPAITITEEDGVYKFTSASSFRNHVTTFTPGVEYDETGFDGKTYKCVTTINGNTVTHNILSNPQSTIVSEFGDDTLTLKFSAGGITSTRVFKKI